MNTVRSPQPLSTARFPGRPGVRGGLCDPAGIYAITHRATGRKYVGKSLYLNNRMSTHRGGARRGKSDSPILRALIEYGVEAFDVEVLEECDCRLLDEREKFWIAALDTIATGFNATQGGAGAKHSAATIAKTLATKRARQPARVCRYLWAREATGRQVVLSPAEMVAAFPGLTQSSLSLVARGRQGHHKGWTVLSPVWGVPPPPPIAGDVRAFLAGEVRSYALGREQAGRPPRCP